MRSGERGYRVSNSVRRWLSAAHQGIVRNTTSALRAYMTADGRLPQEEWLRGPRDAEARARMRARLARVQAGNLGDCKPLRDGVQALRIDHGAGYRVYISRQGSVLVLLLYGSDKGDQDRSIRPAVAFLNDWKDRGKS